MALLSTLAVALCVATASADQGTPPTAHVEPDREDDVWGGFEPGKGFQLAKGDFGELNVSLSMMARYLNQLPAGQSFTDHLGRERSIVSRNDIQLHRVMMWVSGWVYSPKLNYTTIFWTTNSTAQVAIGGWLSYQFHKAITVGAGYVSLPGTRSMLGLFPYFLGSDRTMADEFFRPGFSGGAFISGEPLPRLFYRAMLANNLSALGVNALKLTRSLTPSVSVWWQPTTGEFGPRGGFGDYERHDKLATRFGASFTYSRENRRNQPDVTAPDNTQIRLADSVLVFETGAIVPGVTVDSLGFNLLAVDAGFKWKGFHLQAEYYRRWLTKFIADGPLPVKEIVDDGFYAQASYMALAKKLMVYAGTSLVTGDFNTSWEVIGGLNYFPFDTRNARLTAQVIGVRRSAFGNAFGYYASGQTGTILSLSADVFF